MKHFILGTAGHVDHGKTSLIKALTQVDTDRLPEEQARGLSIDLGFAPLLLDDPGGSAEPIHLGVVDVPGHHKFLRNMIAGVGGFDAALLVVDCCEGVKPQTREHLRILELLQTRRGVVALSKVDKSDADGVEIARWELEELLAGTFLQGAPVVATSAHSGEGLEALKGALYHTFMGLEERNPAGVARLPIDRSFSKTGFGDVVTGSLWSGTLKTGTEVEILPEGNRGKVRGLQVHGEGADTAIPGQRVAVNISGLDKMNLSRGQTLISPPGAFPVGDRFAVSLTLLEPRPELLQRKFKATFFQGTFHHQVSVNLVAERDSDLEVYGQILFPEGVLLARGDRFLLRDETDQNLLAGGTVLALEEKPFRRKYAAKLLSRYQALAGGGEVGRVLQMLSEKGGQAKEGIIKKKQGLSEQEWQRQLALLLQSGQVVRVGKDRLWEAEGLNKLSRSITDLLQKLAQAAPWKIGWKAQELASLLNVKSGRDQGLGEVLDRLIEEVRLKRIGPLYSPADHEPVLGDEAQTKADEILAKLESDAFAPRDWQAYLDGLKEDKRLVEQVEDFLFGTGRVVRLSEKLATTPGVLLQARTRLTESAPKTGFTASEARQHLDTSRKYVIPILEWMDQQGWTLRVGDNRVLSQREEGPQV